MVNAACINQGMRYVPESPVHNGIEEFTEYEAARRALLRDAEEATLPSFIALQREISTLINEADGTARGLGDTLEFLTREAPKRTTFEAEFEERRRQGMRPNMPKKVFVDSEFQNALVAYNRLIAKGEDAVRLCETVSIAGREDYNNLPDWVAESMQNKLIE
jgi:isopropylmalate/homocitrate/citramalate synthase